MANLNMIEALRLALRQEMEKDDSIIILGEDVGVDGGVFRVTEGLIDEFGPERVIDMPLAESLITGASVGMALYGLRPVCELQFCGFSYEGFHQIESHAARYRRRTQGRFAVPMVVRMPYGAGVRALEHHSESREIYYAHTPGLKTVIPSGPRNARALLVAAMRDPDPVVFLEPKAVYRAFREEVPEEEEVLPIGRAEIVRAGDDLTLIAYGAMLSRTLEAAEVLHQDDGVSAEVIDLRTIAPMDDACFCESARKTGRVVVVHEAPRSFGVAAEVVARLNEKSFYYLEAPVERVTGFDTQVPYFVREQSYLPGKERIVSAARRALES
ncbi:MAG: alpha-ketoacid dehydrogenase subunit beta [Acidobacteriota bacterium]|jgi:pyruvate dehydrogenase E1 component beta subunit